MINVEENNESEGALLGGRSQMIEIIKRCMNEQIVPVEDCKSYLENPSEWRFRCRTLPFAVHGHVGIKTLVGFEDVIRGAIFDIIRTIGIFAKHGTWGVAAWELTDGTQTENIKIANEDKAWTIFDGTPNPQKTKMSTRSVETLVLTIVFVDVSKTPEIDVLLEKTGRPGHTSRYLETKNPERLHPRLKGQHQQCMNLIAKRAKVETVESVDLFLSEAKMETVKKLRESGAKWTDLGKMLDVDWRELRKTLKLADGGESDANASEKAMPTQ